MSAGVRLEPKTFSVALGARAWQATSSNEDLTLTQSTLGAWASAVRFKDVGRLSPGLGLAGGVDATWQTFDTTGTAESRTSWSGRLGPTARLDIAVTPRVTLGFEVAADIAVVPITEDDVTQIEAAVVPRGGIDVSFWLR